LLGVIIYLQEENRNYKTGITAASGRAEYEYKTIQYNTE